MAQDVFIDTNIWLYAFINQSTDFVKQTKARTLIQNVQPIVSVQVINEIYVNLIKKAKVTEDEISQLIESFYTNYRVIDLTQVILIRASQLRQQYSLSYWDSLIVASALIANVTEIYSEDMQHELVISNQITIINPFK
jgi:predicted nucleic acid-binding protein